MWSATLEVVLVEGAGVRSGGAEHPATWRHGGKAARHQLVYAGGSFFDDAPWVVVPADHDTAIATPLQRRVSPPELRLRPVGDDLEMFSLYEDRVGGARDRPPHHAFAVSANDHSRHLRLELGSDS